MIWFRVYGEYGPQAGDSVERKILAKNRDRALDIFEDYARKIIGDWTYENRMGRRNIYVEKI